MKLRNEFGATPAQNVTGMLREEDAAKR